MSKKRKQRGKRQRHGPRQPEPRKRKTQPKKNWLVPMILGAISIVALILGGPSLVGLIMDRSPDAKVRPSSVTTEGSRQPAAKSEAKPRPEASRKPEGRLARLPDRNLGEVFANDSSLVDAFSQAQRDLASGKSPMLVRRSLERALPDAKGNPGREHILYTLAFTSLEARDGQSAKRHLDSLVQDYPESGYIDVAQVMQLEAEYLMATPQGKDAVTDRKALRSVAERAESLADASLETELQAYSRLIAARAHDRAGEKEAALAGYLELADRYPESPEAPEALLSAGNALRGQNDNERALETLETLAKKYPKAKEAKGARKMIRELRVIGKPAPALRVEEWVNGEPSPLESLRGKVVLVNFWQTWCPHCREELPHLAELYERYREDGFVVIGVTKNDKRQDEAILKSFLEANPMPFPIARVSPASSTDYAVSGIPAAALVDKDGVIRYRSHPASIPPGAIERLLAQDGGP